MLFVVFVINLPAVCYYRCY